MWHLFQKLTFLVNEEDIVCHLLGILGDGYLKITSASRITFLRTKNESLVLPNVLYLAFLAIPTILS